MSDITTLKKELYFPEIEIYDENWLKRALLYKPGIVTMIPMGNNDELSERHRYIQNELNFFDYFNNFNEFQKVNTNFKGFVEDETTMASHFCNDKSVSLHYYFKNDPKDTEILNGKMIDSLIGSLIVKEYAVKRLGKIYVSKKLALLYMAFMAEEVAGKHKYNITSTEAQFGEYQNLLLNLSDIGYSSEPEDNVNKYFSIFMEQVLPEDIENISFMSIIRMRKKRDYEDSLVEYNRLLNKIRVEEGDNGFKITEDTFKEISSVKHSFKRLLMSELSREVYSTAISALIPGPGFIKEPLISYSLSKVSTDVMANIDFKSVKVTHKEKIAHHKLLGYWSTL